MPDRAVTAAIRPTPASEQTRKWEDPNPTKSMGSWGMNSVPGAPAGLLSTMFRMAETERIQRPFAQSGIVHACVQARAELFCAARPQLWESDEDEADELPPDDELARLFARPNPIMGRVKFWRTVSQHFSLAGGTFLFLTKPNSDEPISAGEMPGAMWPIREDLIEITLDKQNRPALYAFVVGNKPITFPEHAVAHIYDQDPDNPYRGIGPMQAAFRAVNNLFLAEGFDDALVRSGGQIGGFITPQDGMSLGIDQQKELIDSLQQKNLDPKKSGKWAVTPEGLKFQAAAWSPRDMDAKDLRIIGRNHVMMVFRLTPPLLGIVEDVNRANGSVARRIFYESHGIPFFELISDEIQTQLFTRIGRPEVTLSFDWQSIPAMREDADAEQKRVRGWMECGRSFREACALEEIEIDEIDAMEGVDERYIANGLTPVELAHMPPPAPLPVAEPGAAKPAPASDKALEKSARDRRESAVQAEERRLDKADRRMKAAIRRVFEDYVLAQRKKLREVAASGARAIRGVKPWHMLAGEGWTDLQHAWARALDYDPGEGAARWIEVRAINEDELTQLVLGNETKWGEELWAAIDGPLKGVLEEAARAAHKVVGGAFLDATDPAIIAFLRAKEILVKEGPMSVVAEQVKRALIAGMLDAPTAGTLADRVREALESVEDQLTTLQDRLGTRAARIARTETASASNNARVAQYRTSGISQIEWASDGGPNVRPSHQLVDGEIRVIGEVFSNGIRWPHDQNGPPEEIIECHCVPLPVIPDLDLA